MEKRELEEKTNLAQSILEIIAQKRDVHILMVKGQLQEISKITGRSLDNSKFEETIQQLEKKKLIKKIDPKNDIIILTSKGKEYLE